MFKTLIILALIGITLVEAKETCKEKIMKNYPNSKCVDVDDLKDCKAECEHLGWHLSAQVLSWLEFQLEGEYWQFLYFEVR